MDAKITDTGNCDYTRMNISYLTRIRNVVVAFSFAANHAPTIIFVIIILSPGVCIAPWKPLPLL